MTDKKKIILVVDDEQYIATALKMRLEKRGFSVTACLSGEEALEKLSSEKYDAMTLDLKMPEVDGFAVLDKLKGTANKAMPVYVVTNVIGDDKFQRARSYGAREIFVKAKVDLKDIVERIAGDLLPIVH